MRFFDFRDFDECSNAFPESYHDVEDHVPVLMSEVDSHFLFVLGSLLIDFSFLVDHVEPPLHLPELGGGIPPLSQFHFSVVLAQVHQLISTIKKPLQFLNDILVDRGFGISFLLLFSEVELVQRS